ncbi:4'-phosphopantetheinyl transferase family protein [Xenophilus sp.]|uniref:4'-phosphopantetheinyl transferase family protein n=1 Tax=Xenophilus sp. TaxID=1873499 RepID=UPI0037DD75BB
MTAHDPPSDPEWQWLPWSPGQAAEPVVRAWLGQRLGVAADKLRIERDLHGRPRLASHPGADAGWSHSGDGLVAAMARGARVGIDLERERPRPRALALARRYFTPEEAAWLQAQPDEAGVSRAFLRLWCAREAVLKAHGRGLAFGLQRLRFAERDGALVLAAADPALGDPGAWQLREFVPRPGYLAALAWTMG